MAIYSLRLTPIGKTTQRQPFTAAAHVGYIARKGAATHTMAERMPEAKVRAMRWLRAEEKADRVNARVADKLVIALPRELTLQQQITLVHTFSEKLTQGRASWFASIHAKRKDRENPHCHLLVRDRDIHNRQRVVMFSAGAKEVRERAAKGLSAPTTLQDIRAMWEQFANQALQEAGRVERIDRRTLAEQGIARSAQVHEGPNIRAMHERGFRPQSRDRVSRNRAVRRRGVPPTRIVRYPEIDRGLTRFEYNTALRHPLRVAMEDRMRVRAGEPVRENMPLRAQLRKEGGEPRAVVSNPSAPARVTLAVPTSPFQQAAGSHQKMRTEDLSPTARLLKLKQEERERSAAAQISEPPRAISPVTERPRAPVETPVRTGGLSFVARLLREEEARRETATPAPEPPRAMSPTVPTPPLRYQAPVSHEPMRAEGLSPTARLLKIIKQEEKERSAARSSELPRAAAPIAEPSRPPVEAPVREEELSLSARLRKIKEEEARRTASAPTLEPPRAMSPTERLRQAKGIQAAEAMPAQQRSQERER